MKEIYSGDNTFHAYGKYTKRIKKLQEIFLKRNPIIFFIKVNLEDEDRV